MESVVTQICQEKKGTYENISLLARTMTLQIEELAGDFKEILQNQVNSDAADDDADDDDESTDFKNTQQLAIFVRGVNSKFTIKENLAELVALKRSTTKNDILDGFLECASEIQLDLRKLMQFPRLNTNHPTDNSICVNFIQDLRKRFEIRSVDMHSKKTDFSLISQPFDVELDSAKFSNGIN